MIWALLLLACGTPQQGVSPAEQTDGLKAWIDHESCRNVDFKHMKSKWPPPQGEI